MKKLDDTEAEEIWQLERRRIDALVARDFAAASEILADDFQLFPPSGGALTKEQYLGALQAGVLRYRVWEIAERIGIRLYDGLAVIRYMATIEIEVEGQILPAARYRFTDLYETRDGRRQIVWSQGTLATS